jgi:uncharacterized protein
MLPDLKLAIRLQELDHSLAGLTKEIAALPKHIAVIESKLVSHTRKLEADRAALAANQEDRKKCDAGIQAQEQKISKLKTQMLDAKTNEQYRAFQNEIEFSEKEIRQLEERILELMGESEPLAANVATAETHLKTEKAAVDAEKESARVRSGGTEKQLRELQAERAALVAQMTPGVYQRYERTRRTRRGIAVAEATDGTCTVCNITIRLQYYQDIKRGDEVLTCENCQRILYYNPPIPVEDLAGEQAAS